MSQAFIISDTVKADIDRWLAKYPPDQKASAVVSALLLVQKQNNNWLSEPAMDAVADYLHIPRIAVYEVASFYDMYHLAPIGRYKISLCTNVSCLLMGSTELAACLKKRLGIGFNETTPDGLFTLKEVECMAACNGAPMCQINDAQYHENLTEEKLLTLVDRLIEESRHHVA